MSPLLPKGSGGVFVFPKGTRTVAFESWDERLGIRLGDIRHLTSSGIAPYIRGAAAATTLKFESRDD